MAIWSIVRELILHEGRGSTTLKRAKKNTMEINIKNITTC